MIRRSGYSNSASGGVGGLGIRLIIGLVIAAISIISFLGSRTYNDVTGENQYLSLTPEQEIALGLQSAPEMIQEFGGVEQDSQAQQLVDTVGQKLISSSKAKDTPWQFEFTVLSDPQTVNAFALPGGPIFITDALLSRLQDEGQVAGVLAHEMTHVLARHSAQQIAKSDLTNGLLGAVSVASGDANAAQTAAMVAQLINLKYGRDDETQADRIGVCLMIDAGYDPNKMIEVMQILKEASGGSSQPEFASTHPDPDNRIAKIQDAIANASTQCPL